MPSTKKRINLTVPDHIYQQLQDYKYENALESDATACLQLIVRQLRANEDTKVMIELMRSMTPEQLQQIASAGVIVTKQELDNQSSK